MTEIGKLTMGGNLAAAFDRGGGEGSDTVDVYVGPVNGPRRLYGRGVKSGVCYTPLCERAAGDHLWITLPDAEPTVANLTFYK